MPKLHAVTERIWTIDEFLSPDECAEWIDWAEAEGFSDAPITTPMGPMMAKDVRNNERVMVDDPERAAALFERVAPFLPERAGFGTVVGLNERLRFYRYDPGQAFRWHYDGAFRRDADECSRLTFMVYLNDGFEGGETVFAVDGPNGREFVSIEPSTGTVLLFIHQQLHEGAELLAGRKYVLRSDVMYRR